jgi:hypothetical protein
MHSCCVLCCTAGYAVVTAGTPSIALAKGRGVLAVSDVLVTWVSGCCPDHRQH